MSYVGNTPADKFLTLEKQSFSVSATTGYTLSHSVSSPQDIALFINNVRQNPNSSYTVSGTALTLSSATSSGDTMYCVFLGKAIGTVGVPVNGVGTSQIADNAVTSAKLASGLALGKIGQVLQTEVTEQSYSNSSTSPAEITNLNVAITPSATSSKVLVMGKIMFGSSSTARNFIQLRRGDTKIGNNASAGSRQEVIGVATSAAVNDVMTVNFHYIDSPSTTNATTYKVFGCREGSGTFRLNRSENDTDDATVSRGTSVITVMEVLA